MKDCTVKGERVTLKYWELTCQKVVFNCMALMNPASLR